MFYGSRACFVVFLAWVFAVQDSRGDDRAVPRLNQIQVIGSHNSYHIAPDPAILKLIEATRPGGGKALEYTHRPLGEQFSKLGIRQIELDVYADPAGGLYANPHFGKLLNSSAKQHDPEGLLKKPGTKILHVPDIDFRTTALTFVDGLKQIHEWSRANPRHVPIFVLVELKDGVLPGLTKPAPFDMTALDTLETEILSVFGHNKIITPDDVRRDHESFLEALQKEGWPKLDDVRGKVIFAMDNEDAIRDRYLDGHAASKGRLMFVSVNESNPAAAWMKINDPIHDFERIKSLVSRGFMVRTRADADTSEARKNDVTRREKALASGAQFVSTDFREAVPEISDYQVVLPGGVVARTNPVSGDPAFKDLDLESFLPTHR